MFCLYKLKQLFSVSKFINLKNQYLIRESHTSNKFQQNCNENSVLENLAIKLRLCKHRVVCKFNLRSEKKNKAAKRTARIKPSKKITDII